MITKENAALYIELARRELQRRSLLKFSRSVMTGFRTPKHIQYLAHALTRAAKGDKEYRRVIVHMPPQHGKTQLISKLFPAWMLGLKPETNFILTAYNDEYATSFGRAIRAFVSSPEYESIFPHVRLSVDSKAAGRWNIEGHQGGVLSSGIFGGITGNPANFLIIDDPYKHLEDAESADYRRKVEDAYKTVLSTRLHSKAPVWLVMTRWNESDLAGWLMTQSGENWKYLKFPALAQSNDIIGRRRLEALWPWRKAAGMLVIQRRLMGEYLWNAMYQGDPAPLEGLLFKRSHFRIVGPMDVPQHLDWARYWDLAATEDRKADPTASLNSAYTDNGDLIYKDGINGRWEWPVVRSLIKTTALAEPGVRVGIESQGTQKGMVQEAWRDPQLRGVGIWGYKVARSKRIRAYPLVARGEAGKIILVNGPWVEPFIKECIEFDNGAHDDWVDAATGCNMMQAMAHGYKLPVDGEESRIVDDLTGIAPWYATSEVKEANNTNPADPYWSEVLSLTQYLQDMNNPVTSDAADATLPWFFTGGQENVA